jgi:hypothetical protein
VTRLLALASPPWSSAAWRYCAAPDLPGACRAPAHHLPRPIDVSVPSVARFFADAPDHLRFRPSQRVRYGGSLLSWARQDRPGLVDAGQPRVPRQQHRQRHPTIPVVGRADALFRIESRRRRGTVRYLRDQSEQALTASSTLGPIAGINESVQAPGELSNAGRTFQVTILREHLDCLSRPARCALHAQDPQRRLDPSTRNAISSNTVIDTGVRAGLPGSFSPIERSAGVEERRTATS